MSASIDCDVAPPSQTYTTRRKRMILKVQISALFYAASWSKGAAVKGVVSRMTTKIG